MCCLIMREPNLYIYWKILKDDWQMQKEVRDHREPNICVDCEVRFVLRLIGVLQ